MGPQKHYFLRHFGASEIAATKARLLKHDLPVRGIGTPKNNLGGRFDFFFSARGRGRRSPGRQEGGEAVFIENLRRGGGLSKGGARGGREGSAANLGGATYFFSGPKRPPRKLQPKIHPRFVSKIAPKSVPKIPPPPKKPKFAT